MLQLASRGRGGTLLTQPPARLPCPLRLGIRELEAGRSGGGLQGQLLPHAHQMFPSRVDPTLLSESQTVCPSIPDLSLHRLGGFGTQQPELCSRWAGGDPPAPSGRPHSVDVLLLPVLEATPAWAGGPAIQQTYLRGQGAGIEL